MVDERAKDFALWIQVRLRDLQLADGDCQSPVSQDKSQPVILVLRHWEATGTGQTILQSQAACQLGRD